MFFFLVLFIFLWYTLCSIWICYTYSVIIFSFFIYFTKQWNTNIAISVVKNRKILSIQMRVNMRKTYKWNSKRNEICVKHWKYGREKKNRDEFKWFGCVPNEEVTRAVKNGGIVVASFAVCRYLKQVTIKSRVQITKWYLKVILSLVYFLPSSLSDALAADEYLK